MDILIAAFSSSVLTAVITGIFNLISQRKKKDNGVQAGIRIVLYDRIKYLGRRYIENNCIMPEDLEDILEMHRIYHDDLDGNGYLDSVMCRVKALPIAVKCHEKT